VPGVIGSRDARRSFGDDDFGDDILSQ